MVNKDDEDKFIYRQRLMTLHNEDLYKHVAFYYGLPSSGKSTKLAEIQRKYDHGQDLCINLRGYIKINGIYYTPNFIRVKNNRDVNAYPIPLHSRFADQRALRLYAYEHPVVPRILVDECQELSVTELDHLISDLCNIFQFTDTGSLSTNRPLMAQHGHTRQDPYIILSGIIYNAYNKIYPASTYLLHQPQCHLAEAHTKCKYCSNRAQYMLSTIHGKKVTYSQLDQLPKNKNKAIRHYMYKHHTRYHVCPYHYAHPPMEVIRNPLLEL